MTARRATGAALLAALAMAGCGGEGRSPRLSWQGAPQVFVPASLPRDRVAVARIRNAGDASARLQAARVVVRDAAGRRLEATAQFAAGYAHGLYGAYQKPSPLPPGELSRLGLTLELRPGRSAPLTIAYRLPPTAREPVRVEVGGTALTLPRRARSGAPGV